MAGDWRVVVVKLADRLHNMRTLEFMPPKKRTRIARETLEIFAPLAHRLGIWTYKTELEDAAFRHLYPGEYLALDTAIKGRRKRCEAALESCRQQLEEMLYGDELVRGRARRIRVEGRAKSAYSTWKKMRRQQCGLERVDDLVALRVILEADDTTESVEDDTALCYHVLGKVHGRWTPLPRTLKDYISSPKPNGYRSLHTTVLVGSQPLEVQIRTDDMHRVAELGAAAHWSYKDETASLPWLQIIGEWEAQVDSASVFMELVRNELLGSRVFVFAPQGRILNLAKGATLNDAVAHVIQGGDWGIDVQGGALVNEVSEASSYVLRNGDIISFAAQEELPLQEREPWQLCSVCRPLPGDAVHGVAAQHSTRGTVHRANCDCEVLRRELERPGARFVDGAALAMNDDDYDAVRQALGPSFSASRGAPVPSRHRRDSFPSHNEVGGSFFDFEAIRTESSDRDAPRRSSKVKDAFTGEVLGYDSSLVVFGRDRTRMLLDISQAVSMVNIVDVMSETRAPGGQAAFQYTVHVDDRDHLDRLFEAIREVPDVVRVVRGSMRLLKRKGTHAFWAMALPDSEDDSPPSAPPLGI